MIKRLILFFLIGFITWLYAIFSKVNDNPNTITSEEEANKKSVRQEVTQLTKVDKIIGTSKSYLGVPYKQAGTTKKGFDCSGLIMVSFAKQGVSLPRASYEMVKKGNEISVRNIRRGDLLFFTTNPKRPNRVSHVGLVTSIEDGTVHFIHSSTQKGVIISTLDENYYKESFFKAKRVL